MDWLLGIFGSAGFGTLLGGVFGWLSKREERENLQMQMDHEARMVEARTQSQVKLAEANIKQAETAGKLAVEKAEADAFVVSQSSGFKFSEAIKSIIRPIILFLLLYQSYLVTSNIDELVGGLKAIKDHEELVAIYKLIIMSILSLTSTAVGWYFAQRTSKQFDKLLDISMKKTI